MLPLVAAIAVVAGGAYAVARRLRGGPTPADVSIVREADDDTGIDRRTGAVRSVQTAEVALPADRVDALWSPLYLERLARTYLRFLTRATLGVVRVFYAEDQRSVCLLLPSLRLLTFAPPEYAMDERRGVVRWSIVGGLLVARRGRRADGYLEIDVQRRPAAEPGRTLVHVEVEVADFHPAIASAVGRWVYANTQSRMHVLVTHGFLRSLARLDLAESRVGRFSSLEQVPDPRLPPPSERQP
jgi:hypothetical protein